jgi:selenoprotein W-related protein
MNNSQKPRIVIRYCPKCRWLLRAGWLAQELLSTFSEEIAEVAIAPAESGTFEIIAQGTQVWDRKTDGGFPEAKELKKRVRNVIAPEKDLGHSDR